MPIPASATSRSPSAARRTTRGIRSIGASPSIQNVTIRVSVAGYQSYGIGTTSSSAYPTIKHTVINLSGSGSYAYGLYSDGVTAPLEMRDLEISIVGSNVGAYGFYVDNLGSSQTFLLTGSTLSVSGATYNWRHFLWRLGCGSEPQNDVSESERRKLLRPLCGGRQQRREPQSL